MKKYNIYKIYKIGKCRNCGETKVLYPVDIAVNAEFEDDPNLICKISIYITDVNGKNFIKIDNSSVPHCCNAKEIGVVDVVKTIIEKTDTKEMKETKDFLAL